MQRIRNGRRDITIHGNADKDDVPVSEFPDDARVMGSEGFVPANMKEPTVYLGDIVVGVYDGEIEFVDLIYDKTDDSVMLDPLDTGGISLMDDQLFSRRFFQADEIHIYDSVVEEKPSRDGLEFDESKIERPEPARSR